MKKVTLFSLVALFSFQSLAQSLDLSQVFTTPSKVVKIKVPVESFIVFNPTGDCNNLPQGELPACHVSLMIDRNFRKDHFGKSYINSRDNMLMGKGYGPKVLEELKKNAEDGMITGNLFVKYLYQPAWHSSDNHGGMAQTVCSLIEIAQASFVVKTGTVSLEFTNLPDFVKLGLPHNVKLRLDPSLCPSLK